MSMMKLYGVALRGEIPFENLSMAIWASSEAEAIAYWRQKQNCENDDGVSIDCWDCDVDATPEADGVHEELRKSVLKLAGWHEEGEFECESCGEWSSDVSEEYRLCPKCYAKEIGE